MGNTALQSLSIEMQVLACCARVRPDSGQRARLEELLSSESLDWRRLFMMASRHKMMPLLYWHLKEIDALSETPQMQSLSAAFRRTAAHTLAGVDRLREIMRAFEAADVLVVPYKGAALAVQLYGNVALRPPGDIDIVIRKKDALKARSLLFALGYQLRYPVGKDNHEFRLANRYCEEFVSPDRVFVELHWAFTNGDVRFPLFLEDVTPRLVPVRIAGTHVLTFGREDLLLILSAHGAKHCWRCLEWICGVSELVRETPQLDWNAVLDRARALGAVRMVLLALYLAHELLQAPVPEDIRKRVFADKRVAILAAKVPGLLEEPGATDESLGSTMSDLFHFHLRERFMDRVRYIFYRITTPSQPESWRVLRIGRFLFPLHAFLRPLRLAGRVVPAIRSYMAIARVSRNAASDQ
jgi:hypothetical protein